MEIYEPPYILAHIINKKSNMWGLSVKKISWADNTCLGTSFGVCSFFPSEEREQTFPRLTKISQSCLSRRHLKIFSSHLQTISYFSIFSKVDPTSRISRPCCSSPDLVFLPRQLLNNQSNLHFLCCLLPVKWGTVQLNRKLKDASVENRFLSIISI